MEALPRIETVEQLSALEQQMVAAASREDIERLMMDVDVNQEQKLLEQFLEKLDGDGVEIVSEGDDDMAEYVTQHLQQVGDWIREILAEM